MKVFVVICSLVLTLTAVKSQTTFTDAVAFNDYIVAQQLIVGEAINALLNVTELDSASVWSELNESTQIVKKCNVNIKLLQAFDNDNQLLMAAQNLFQYYEEVFVYDYPKFVKVLYALELSEAETTLMNTTVNNLTEREAILDAKFAEAQVAFAEKHGFTLDETVIDDEY